MIRPGTIFIAFLLYIGFVWLRIENPHLNDIPMWQVVMGCLIGAYFLRIPTSGGAVITSDSSQEKPDDPKIKPDGKEVIDPNDVVCRIGRVTYDFYATGKLAKHFPDTKELTDRHAFEAYLRELRQNEERIIRANELRLLEGREYLLLFNDIFILTSRALYILHRDQERVFLNSKIEDYALAGITRLVLTINTVDGQVHEFRLNLSADINLIDSIKDVLNALKNGLIPEYA